MEGDGDIDGGGNGSDGSNDGCGSVDEQKNKTKHGFIQILLFSTQ